MGGRYSKDTEISASEATEAIVVTIEGEALRLQRNTMAEEVLKTWPGHFLCDSDGLCVGERISNANVVGAQDSLRAGQLYFVLPLQMLHCVFTDSDMAALLQRASAALRVPLLHESKQGQRRRGDSSKKNKIQALVFLPYDQNHQCLEDQDHCPALSMPSHCRLRVAGEPCTRSSRSRLETIDEEF